MTKQIVNGFEIINVHHNKIQTFTALGRVIHGGHSLFDLLIKSAAVINPRQLIKTFQIS